MWPFKPAWKSESEGIAIEAVEEITDEKQLKKIAVKAPYSSVRRSAIVKIADLEFLKERARNDFDKDVRFAAIKKITDKDQEFFKERARNDSDNEIRFAAINLNYSY